MAHFLILHNIFCYRQNNIRCPRISIAGPLLWTTGEFLYMPCTCTGRCSCWQACPWRRLWSLWTGHGQCCSLRMNAVTQQIKITPNTNLAKQDSVFCRLGWPPHPQGRLELDYSRCQQLCRCRLALLRAPDQPVAAWWSNLAECRLSWSILPAHWSWGHWTIMYVCDLHKRGTLCCLNWGSLSHRYPWSWKWCHPSPFHPLFHTENQPKSSGYTWKVNIYTRLYLLWTVYKFLPAINLLRIKKVRSSSHFSFTAVAFDKVHLCTLTMRMEWNSGCYAPPLYRASGRGAKERQRRPWELCALPYK